MLASLVTTLLFAAIALLSACGARAPVRGLVPAPGTPTLDGRVAFAEESGIRMIATPNRWSGSPANLERFVTPFHIAIENRGERMLRVRYNELALAGPPGSTFSALPPYQAQGKVVKPIHTGPTYDLENFYVAPHFEPYYPEEPKWSHPWDFDKHYYKSRYSLWTYPLPTEDMLAKALPEGVLEPRGRVSGFVYFERVDPQLKRITLTADLVNAETGKSFGTLRIPFAFQ